MSRKINKKKKLSMSGGKRCFGIGAGILLLICTGIFGIWYLPDKNVTIKNTDYSYLVTADTNYRVKLLPNELYDSEWLEEGILYSNALTDQIEVSVKAFYNGSAPASVTGQYRIVGVLEGYQETKDGKRIIYEKRYPLKEGEEKNQGDSSCSVEETLMIDRTPYQEDADLAEVILGAAPARHFYLQIDGGFQADTEYEPIDASFSLTFPIPLNSQNGLYEIVKPVSFSDQREVTSTSQISVPPDKLKPALFSLGIIVGIVEILWILFGTRLPDKEEIYKMKVRALLRKHGSRMLKLNCEDQEILVSDRVVADINNLILISEEIHRPIHYQQDEDGYPRNGMLYVPDQETKYVLYLREGSTTLVPETTDQKGTMEGEKK